YADEITVNDLRKHLEILASDEFEGRKTGEPGQKKAAEYIRNFYKQHQIPALPGTEDYYQLVPSEAMKRMFSPKLNDSENVIAYIQEEEFTNEYIVISTHYDHICLANSENFNSADDNASVTTTTMVLAKLYQQAKIDGHGPKRSIIFLH